jgi:hypothetical protein
MLRENGLDKEYEIKEDPACVIEPRIHGKKKMLPLYCDCNSNYFLDQNIHQLDICWVDIIIKKWKINEIPIVIEIDESITSPHHICGKFLTAAVSRYYHDGNDRYPLSPKTLFIQVVKTKVEPSVKSQMRAKWKILEDYINNNLLIENSRIKGYLLFWGYEKGNELVNENGNDFIESIQNHMKST